MNFSIDTIIFVLAALLIIGVLTAKFSTRLGLPALVFFVAVGMGLGSYVYFDNAKITQLFGILALIIIIFEGGIQTRWKDLRSVIKPAGSLATIGVLVTAAVAGLFAKFILDLSWLESFLFGSIVGSTDAAAVFSVLGSKNIRKKLTATLEAESGSNDPMAMFLTVTFVELVQHPDSNILTLILTFLWEMGFGLVIGILIGKAAVWIINKIDLDSSGLYPVLTLGLGILSYGTAVMLHASGLLAVYVTAVIIGNSPLTFRHSIIRFNEGFAWMMQILMFILLGLLVFPEQLLEITWEGILLAFLLMLVARPLGVFISMALSKYSFKEKIFISWAGLRGAVPIVLATYPLMANLENDTLIFNVVFFVVLLSALLQGATISPLAKMLHLSEGETKVKSHTLELVSIGKTNNELIELEIPARTPYAGIELRDIDLPTDTLITGVIRGERLITPRGDTVLQGNDTLYILVSKKNRDAIQELFGEKEGDPSVS
ncbi:potassium/proton antiporter [Bacillus mangrovi]|uniref:Potassium/proton antiporter n=1 Tax=Metabacillus mangrovi TaxID=1491830 RepID=A0A7X2S8K6_9BACI|nr:potassium/proton antiporter [Metabacillus mangrovi]MTH55684.1 potassium/proton antiporter [Metabacillus mangrovi]